MLDLFQNLKALRDADPLEIIKKLNEVHISLVNANAFELAAAYQTLETIQSLANLSDEDNVVLLGFRKIIISKMKYLALYSDEANTMFFKILGKNLAFA